jgi:hypothetical protein
MKRFFLAVVVIIGIAAAKTIAITRPLARADFAGFNCRRLSRERSRWNFLPILSGAKSRRARPDRSVALRVDSINQLYG